MLTIGVVGTSYKENEKRVPIHPDHIAIIPQPLKEYIYYETGYASHLGMDDEYLQKHCACLMSRKALFAHCDIIILPKPEVQDEEYYKEGQIVWGWQHLVQQESVVEVGINKHLTLLAWESMFHWRGDVKGPHTFTTNNELAGYAAVIHSMGACFGLTGAYGAPKAPRAAVISMGATGRGSIHALEALKVPITVFTQRDPLIVSEKITGVEYLQFRRAPSHDLPFALCEVPLPGGEDERDAVPFGEVLAEYDIIVNCILQDTDHPLNFMSDADVERISKTTLIIDVSCDDAMGFPFARPTSFEEPVFKVGPHITYYAVDHTPSYFYRSASEEISRAVCSFLPVVMGGRAEWAKCPTVMKCVEMSEGALLNPKVLSRQRRETAYPHVKLGRSKL